MITIQISPNYDNLSMRTVLDELSFAEKQFIKKEEITHIINDRMTFTEYNKSSLTYIPHYFRRLLLREDKSVLWD